MPGSLQEVAVETAGAREEEEWWITHPLTYGDWRVPNCNWSLWHFTAVIEKSHLLVIWAVSFSLFYSAFPAKKTQISHIFYLCWFNWKRYVWNVDMDSKNKNTMCLHIAVTSCRQCGKPRSAVLLETTMLRPDAMKTQSSFVDHKAQLKRENALIGIVVRIKMVHDG